MQSEPFVSRAGLGLSTWYGGCLVTPLAEGERTASQLSCWEVAVRKGMEPPPHTHTHEDEAFYVLEGHWTFQIGDRTVDGPPGTWVWLPREVQHGWSVDADGARALVFAFPGGHLEAMFRPFSTPATELALPPLPTDLPVEDMIALDLKLGVRYPQMAEAPG
jgi:quercetin dioxygenase-like cupin family protein